MPKIPNWSINNDYPFYKLVHDTTGDSIEIGPAMNTEYKNNGCPKEYQVTLWARDSANNRVLNLTYTSKKKAKEKAREVARHNPEGQLVKSMYEKRNYLDWGEGSP